MDQEVSIDRLLEESSHCLCFAMLYLSATTKGMSTSGLWHIRTATHTMSSFCKPSVKHPFDTSSIKHSFGTTRNHGLDFTTVNLLRPNFTNANHSLLTNEKQQLKFLFLTLEQQLPGRRAHCAIVKRYTEHFGQSNNQCNQRIAPVVTFFLLSPGCIWTETQQLLWILREMDTVTQHPQLARQGWCF